MKLEVGKRYVDKSGIDCEVIKDAGDGRDSFVVDHCGFTIWHYEDGRANIDGEFDLVREVSPVTTITFQIGETYTVKRGDNYKCISVNDDGSAHLAFDARTPAYVWDADGRSLSLPSEWDIVFHPVIETKHHAVTVEAIG